MRTISIKLRDLPKMQLKIGYEGEQNHTKVIIDCKEEIFDDYPNAAATMVAQPPVGDLYPVILVRDGDRVIWNVARGDVANEGSGSFQLTFTDGSGDDAEIIKTEYGSYYAKASLTATGDAPASIDNWLEEAQQTLSDLEAFDDMTATATTLAAGESATAEIRKILGHKDILIGIPKGDKGDTGAAGADGKDGQDGAPGADGKDGKDGKDGTDGHSPVLTSSKSGKTTTIFSDGVQLAQIQDGQDGSGTNVIDDTAGTGDTTVTWSADKLTSEKSDVMNAINNKVSEPSSEGSSGQVLTTDGNGGRSWTTVQGGGESGCEVVDSDAYGVDLDIADANGYVALRIKNGNIQTKNFDSTSIILANDSTAESDLDVSDSQGNVVLRVKNGMISTYRNTVGYNVVTVKKDGTGDFSDLRSAVDSIKNANYESNPYVIEIYPGTYNVLDDYEEEEITASGFNGLFLSDGISIKGIGNRDDIIIHGELATTYDQALRNNVSTLNLVDSMSIENVTITAKNIRYCVHDDYTTRKAYTTRTVKSCKFRMSNATSGSEQKTWGEGSRSGKTTIIEDCDFGTCMLWHSENQNSSTVPGKLIVKNSIATMAMITCYNHNVMHQVYLYNNQFGIVYHNFYDIGTSNRMMQVNGTGKGAMTCAPASYNYTNGDIVKFLNNGTLSLNVGQLVTPSTAPYWASGSIAAAIDPKSAYGVIVGKDSEWFYVQTGGYFNIDRFGFSNLSIGDKITVTNSGVLNVNGTGDEFGVVCCVTTNYGSYFRRCN